MAIIDECYAGTHCVTEQFAFANNYIKNAVKVCIFNTLTPTYSFIENSERPIGSHY